MCQWMNGMGMGTSTKIRDNHNVQACLRGWTLNTHTRTCMCMFIRINILKPIHITQATLSLSGVCIWAYWVATSYKSIYIELVNSIHCTFLCQNMCCCCCCCFSDPSPPTLSHSLSFNISPTPIHHTHNLLRRRVECLYVSFHTLSLLLQIMLVFQIDLYPGV